MKRMLLAAAVLFGFAAASNADYVLIRAVIGGKKGTDPNNPGGPGGPPDGVPPPGGGVPPPGGPPRGGPPSPGDPGSPDGGSVPLITGGQTVDIDTAGLVVQGVVNVKWLQPRRMGGVIQQPIEHRYSAPKGKSYLFNDGSSILAFRLPPLPSPHSVFERRRQEVYKRRAPDRLMELAEWGLAHGLLDDFGPFMDDLVKNKEDEASGATPQLKAAIKAYSAVKVALAKPSESDANAEAWKRKLGVRSESSDHYAVLYNSPVSNPPEVQHRLKLLEQHLRGVCYWFALKGVALQLPQEKMVCVMIDQPTEFVRQRAILEDEPLVSDGFYAHRDNLCVFSTQRIDGAYRAFSRTAQAVYSSGYERAGLVDGTTARRGTTTGNDFARMQTIALLDRLLEDEADRAAVSHEGSRQIFASTGLVPRSVVPPQWAHFGTAAFFETPKGPFIGAPIAASVAFWPGYGAPSWAYLRPFKAWERQQIAQNVPPADLLKRVVTDTYFNQVINFNDRQGLLRARNTAWSLSYFLMKNRLPGMMRYLQELSGMPRDLEMDDKTLLASFARAFDVANATGDGIDPAKFEDLAKAWLAYMRGVAAPGAEFGLDPRTAGDPNASPGTPGAPGGPDGGGTPGGTPGQPTPPGGRGRPPGGPGG